MVAKSALRNLFTAAALALATVGALDASVRAAEPDSAAPQKESTHGRHRHATLEPKPDLSVRKRVGQASVYDLPNQRMADGRPMNPEGNNAASKTLPLGTKATVTDLDTGKTAVVTIRDRGPYVPGRIVDLSPATAKKIGIPAKQGVAKVAVTPISVPLPDGTVKKTAAAPRRP